MNVLDLHINAPDLCLLVGVCNVGDLSGFDDFTFVPMDRHLNKACVTRYCNHGIVCSGISLGLGYKR